MGTPGNSLWGCAARFSKSGIVSEHTPIRHVTDYTFEIGEAQLSSTITEIAPQLAAIFVCEQIEVLIFVVAQMLSGIMRVSIA